MNDELILLGLDIHIPEMNLCFQSAFAIVSLRIIHQNGSRAMEINHIKTWLWDLSNSFIKFIKDWIVILSRGKHKTITNNTFFNDFPPLDNEIELKTWVSSTKEINLPFFP